MDNSAIDRIIENIFHVFPLVYKKLLKVDFESVQKGMSYLHFHIIRVLATTGALPISEIGKRLFIPRPQMTHLIDQLIDSHMVVRLPDALDRRIVKIELTDTGKAILQKCVGLLRDNIRSKLSYLDDKELRELSVLLSKLDAVTSRLN